MNDRELASYRAHHNRSCPPFKALAGKNWRPRDCSRCAPTMRDPFGRGVSVMHPGCGCKVIGNGTSPQPVRILFCEAHEDVTEDAISDVEETETA